MLLLTMLMFGLSGGLFAQTVTNITNSGAGYEMGPVMNPLTGDIYFVRTGSNSTISKLSSTGVLTESYFTLIGTAFGSQATGLPAFGRSMVADNSGNLYFMGANGTYNTGDESRIVKLNLATGIVDYNFGKLPADPTGSGSPTYGAGRFYGVDNAGNIYMRNPKGATNTPILKLGPAGGTPALLTTFPAGIEPSVTVLDKVNGTLYFSTQGNGFTATPVGKITSAGVKTDSWGAPLLQNFNSQSIALDAAGNVYFCGSNNNYPNNVIKIAPDGTTNYNWYAGTTSNSSLLVDAANNVYVGKASGGTLTKITSAGVATESWVTGLASTGLGGYDALKGYIYIMSIPTTYRINGAAINCAAGTTAPTLSATTKTNTCPATTADISSLITSTTPSGASLVWFTNNAHTGTAYSSPTTAVAGTYYAFYYDATNACYSPASAAVTVTINTCSTPVIFGTPTPAGQTATAGQAKTGNTATELAPTGGTSPYVYSNGSTDPACVAPSGATALPVGSNLTVNSSTGAYTYTAPTTAGTYYYCMKVCDSATTPSCKVATYSLTVSAACAVANIIPVLIKN